MGIMDDWTEIKSEADYVRVKSELELNLGLLKRQQERLQSMLETVTSPLEMMIERALISTERWNSRSVGTLYLYKVQNKVFSITFWNKDEAEDFINKQSTNLHGFIIYPLEVFGDKERWLKENVDLVGGEMRTKEFYEKRLKDGKLTEWEEIICPHCFEPEDTNDFSLDDDGDEESDIECSHCGNLMDIKVKVEKTYTTTQVASVEEE
jgi:hypothetical protein